jgi:2-furoate---CoA ligase
VAGRVDDMINSGGENIYPEEIENALVRCPDVAEVVVAATPHDKWGQAVTAFVVGSAGDPARDTLAKVDHFIKERSGLPSMKRPKRIVIVDRVPKSAVGKILRRKLTRGEYDALADSTEATAG